MVPRSRRSVLRTTALGVGVLAAGCTSSSEPDEPVNETPTNQTSSSPSEGDQGENDGTDGKPLDASGAWPSYRYDAGNTGANPEGVGVQNGTPYWKLTAGGPATVVDGTVYHTESAQTASKLAYRDSTTGTLENLVQTLVGYITVPPVVANGRVFVTATQVYCLDATTGTQLWSTWGDELIGCPTVAGETVLVNDTGSLRALSAESGEEIWRYDSDGTSESVPAVGAQHAFINSEAGLHAIDLASGESTYVLETAAHPWATPVVRDGVVYTRTADGDLIAADATDGTVQWRTTIWTKDVHMPFIEMPSVVTEDVVYTYTEDGLVALDSTDGTVLASYPEQVRPVGLVGSVLYAISDGTVLALDGSTLEQHWSLTPERETLDDTVNPAEVYAVTPVDGAVYVSARDGFYGIGPDKQ